MSFAVSDEQIEALRGIVEAEFGESVSFEHARIIANNLLELHKVLAECASKWAEDAGCPSRVVSRQPDSAGSLL